MVYSRNRENSNSQAKKAKREYQERKPGRYAQNRYTQYLLHPEYSHELGRDRYFCPSSQLALECRS